MSKLFRISIIVIAIIAAVLLVLSRPWFFVNDIEITGNTRLTEAEIRKTMEISDDSVFFWNAPGAKKRLLANHYVDHVDITVDYLSRDVTVTVRERVLSGYVEYVNGIYLYIDENGRVLDSATYFAERLPVLTGLQFTNFTVGEILKVDNPASFERVVTLAQLFNKYQMSAEVIRVDVSKVDDIHLYIGSIDVEFGGIDDADEKIRQIREIMENHLPADAAGFLNIRDVKKPARFRPLQ